QHDSSNSTVAFTPCSMVFAGNRTFFPSSLPVADGPSTTSPGPWRAAATMSRTGRSVCCIVEPPRLMPADRRPALVAELCVTVVERFALAATDLSLRRRPRSRSRSGSGSGELLPGRQEASQHDQAQPGQKVGDHRPGLFVELRQDLRADHPEDDAPDDEEHAD